MKIADYLNAVCWCGRREVEIPVSWVSQGRTSSCDYPGCGPGCEMVGSDDEYDDEDPYEEPVEKPTRKWKMNKYSPARYDPKVDSTPGLPRRADSVSLLVGTGLCACGCGMAPAGKKARFCMGHDARLKGVLARAQSAGVSVALVEESDGSTEVIDPLTYAGRFSTPKVDWVKLTQDAVAKIAERRGGIDRRAAERRLLADAAANGAVRIGRWDKTDSVAAIYRGESGFEVEFVDELGRIKRVQVDVA